MKKTILALIVAVITSVNMFGSNNMNPRIKSGHRSNVEMKDNFCKDCRKHKMDKKMKRKDVHFCDCCKKKADKVIVRRGADKNMPKNRK